MRANRMLISPMALLLAANQREQTAQDSEMQNILYRTNSLSSGA
jgi:hypothetical protein